MTRREAIKFFCRNPDLLIQLRNWEATGLLAKLDHYYDLATETEADARIDAIAAYRSYQRTGR